MTTTHQVIRATYTHGEEFKIPIGVDLNDTSQVKSWGIKWNKLWITYADDGREEEIEGDGWVEEFDYKRPEEICMVTLDEDDNEVDEDDEEEIVVAVEEKCEVCEEVDKEEVGIATGINGVEMRVCSRCDIDGENYNGWGDEEEKCEGCGITAKDEDTGLGLSTLATTNQLLCPTCIPAEDDEDEDEDEDDDRPVCDVCQDRITPDAMHMIDCKGSRVMVDNICDDCLGQALDDRTIEPYSESDDEEEDEHYRWI